jgi:hypothetical protein
MTRLKNQFDFMAGMYLDDELYFNRYSLSIDFYTVGDSPKDQNTAFDRMSYFIYDTVSRSIFIQEYETTKINLLTKAGLPVLTVPGPGPFDPIVLATVVTKMNSILECVLVITNAEIVSEVTGPIIYVWDAADTEDEIHDLVNDKDAAKWWASACPRFGSYPDGSDVAKVEKKQPFPLTWDMLKLGWEGEFGEEEVEYVVDAVNKTKGKKQGTIIKADFTTGSMKPNK